MDCSSFFKYLKGSYCDGSIGALMLFMLTSIETHIFYTKQLVALNFF